jgi:uncharacterized membrane protein YhhN
MTALILRWAGAGMVVAGVLGIAASLLGERGRLTFYADLGASGYLLIALAGGAHKTNYGRLVLIALLCCATGDVFGPHHFFAGVFAFLAAHLFFIAAFAVHGIHVKRLFVSFPLAMLATGASLIWLLPHIPAHDRAPILAYVGVITAMLIAAGGCSLEGRGAWILAAAIVFYVSDIFVARWHYVATAPMNGLYCYPLYYLSCSMFAYASRDRLRSPYETKRRSM